MGSAVIFPDLEAYLVRRMQADLDARDEECARDVLVDRREPDPSDPFPDRLVVVRDDSGDTGFITGDRSVGISVLCADEGDCADLSRLVMALAWQVPGLERGNPVTVTQSSNGPFWVEEAQPRFRRYMTFVYGVAGEPL